MWDLIDSFTEIHGDSNQFVGGCWTGPGRGKEAECHMRIFSKEVLKCIDTFVRI